jgi:tRNA(Ile)-lysidine synthase
VREEAFLETLAAKLTRWQGAGATGFAVAFSGGLDSTLLLNALARLALELPVRALHVDHGLSAESQDWEAACRRAAAALGVPYASTRIDVPRDSGLGLEAAAREERYRVLRGMMSVGEILLTAHHADDQLETVILRMLRGAGTRGLRGIVELAPFGRGQLGRPLLAFGKHQLREQARLWGLDWIDDPANESLAHDRNYLRHRVVPTLEERWPAAPRMAQRLTEQMADAEEILETMALQDASALASADRVTADELTKLSPGRQRNLLRHLVRIAGLAIPSALKLEELRDGVLASAWDARTHIRWPGGEARFYRGALHLLAPLTPASGPDFRVRVGRTRPWSGPEGQLGFVPSGGEGLPQSWLDEGFELRFRAGGERFAPLPGARSIALKRWLHDARIVPWMRGRLPLLYRQGQLVAVADLSLDAAVRDAPNEPRWRVAWSGHPPVR